MTPRLRGWLAALPTRPRASTCPGSVEWIDAPEKPLAAGVIYFTLMAWTRGKTAHG